MAIPGFLENAGRFIARPGRSALIGAGTGAALGMGREALRSGDDTPRSYLGAGLRGAAIGGAAGGAIGGIGRAAHTTMLQNPALKGFGDIAGATAKNIGQDASNFAQRQFHGMTGYGGKDLKYLDRIGIAGEATAAKKMDIAGLHARDATALSARKMEGITDPVARAAAEANHDKVRRGIATDLTGQFKGFKEEGALGQKFQNLGMTSMPGSMKAVVTNPREASKLLWEQMKGNGEGTMGKVMGVAGVVGGVGLPVAFAAHDLSKGDESATGGRNIKQKLLNAGVNTGVGLATGGVGLIPQMAGGMAIDKATDMMGRKFLGTPGMHQAAPGLDIDRRGQGFTRQ